ncbi:putative head-to-tail connector [Mycobacterium phage PP]|uniref:Putative head-to-tail connector n=1 Tax=Mycobacterium phage PP TaxID=2077134 RepID=A0A2Z5XVE4_9CAUD|nr:tail completion or Neck1 protein [Mycobacterium phage PP]BBC53824.1 putative head-to-tail connector [Mycobacterium phage PP]
MALVLYYGKSAMARLIAHKPGVADAVWDEAKERERLAHGILEQVRATTPHHKIFGPDGLTKTSRERSYPDAFFSLNAPNPKAIEFGHDPSGVFAGTDTKPPEGLYILYRAAGLV